MKLLPFKIVVAILSIVLVYALLFTERGWILHDRPVIAHMGSMKAPTDFDLTEALDDYGVHLVRVPSNYERFMRTYKAVRGVNEPFDWGKATDPAVGKSIREMGFFGMPFGWFNDLGDVVYVRNDREFVYAQLNRLGTAAVTKANGRDIFRGNFFPFWTHAWGWLWVAGVGLAVWLWFRAAAKRREELGLID
jgi:hypothetical protein